jgi:ATP-dependent protease ClpP protease subunit
MIDVEGACMSAATMIMLSTENIEVSDNSMFMFHNYSGAAIGKGGEMYDNIVHERLWSERLLRDVYDGFLEEDEINQILDNKDIWMDSEQVRTRLKNRVLVGESLTSEGISDIM